MSWRDAALKTFNWPPISSTRIYPSYILPKRGTTFLSVTWPNTYYYAQGIDTTLGYYAAGVERTTALYWRNLLLYLLHLLAAAYGKLRLSPPDIYTTLYMCGLRLVAAVCRCGTPFASTLPCKSIWPCIPCSFRCLLVYSDRRQSRISHHR